MKDILARISLRNNLGVCRAREKTAARVEATRRNALRVNTCEVNSRKRFAMCEESKSFVLKILSCN